MLASAWCHSTGSWKGWSSRWTSRPTPLSGRPSATRVSVSCVAESKTSALSHWVDRLHVRTPSVRQHVRLLSGGNQQKVVLCALARGRLTRPGHGRADKRRRRRRQGRYLPDPRVARRGRRRHRHVVHRSPRDHFAGRPHRRAPRRQRQSPPSNATTSTRHSFSTLHRGYQTSGSRRQAADDQGT